MPAIPEVTEAVKVTVCPAFAGLRLLVRFVEVAAAITDCASEADVLGLKFPSPLYDATTLCDPAGIAEEVNRATLPDNVAEPSWTPLSTKLTLPVAVPAEVCTVAVKVNAWPKPAGFRLDARAVVVEARVTVSESAADALAENDESPL